MALILCIETSTHLCSVALCDGDRSLATRDEEDREQFTHAERVNVLVGELLEETGRSMKEMNAVAVGNGPGSYTGLRIGLSAAKGFCYALGIPIMGVGSLDVLCMALQGSGFATAPGDLLHPMIDARRMEVFTCAVGVDGGLERAIAPMILDEAWCSNLEPDRRHIVFGDGADKAADLWKSHAENVVHVAGIKPRTSSMAAHVADRYQRKAFDDLAYLTPLYGKDANVTAPGRS